MRGAAPMVLQPVRLSPAPERARASWASPALDSTRAWPALQPARAA